MLLKLNLAGTNRPWPLSRAKPRSRAKSRSRAKPSSTANPRSSLQSPFKTFFLKERGRVSERGSETFSPHPFISRLSYHDIWRPVHYLQNYVFGSVMVTFYFKVPNTEFNLNVVTS